MVEKAQFWGDFNPQQSVNYQEFKSGSSIQKDHTCVHRGMSRLTLRDWGVLVYPWGREQLFRTYDRTVCWEEDEGCIWFTPIFLSTAAVTTLVSWFTFSHESGQFQVNCRTKASQHHSSVCVACLSGFRAWWRLLWQVDGALLHGVGWGPSWVWLLMLGS